jgi:hypothetical protein
MARWPWTVTLRVRQHARAGRVRFTKKAVLELEAMGLSIDDGEAYDVIASLTPDDAAKRIRSSVSGERLYVFRPMVAGAPLYIKLALRQACVVISFHPEDDHDEEEHPA